MNCRKLFLSVMVCLGLVACSQSPDPLSGESQATASQEQSESVSMPVLLKEKGCHACHAEQELLIGPPYIAIASRYSVQQEVMLPVLAEKIRHGGGGAWGVVPMVENEHVSVAEATAMSQWILALEVQ